LTVGRLLGVPLAARFRPSRILLADLLGCLASVSVLLLWPGSQAAAWVAAGGLGFSMASFFPTLIALAERRLTITGRITGWFLAGSSVGGMTLPWLMGQLFEARGPRSAMAMVAGGVLAELGVLGLLMLNSRRLPRQIVVE
jgi:FHS family Na+ dependent glucose MFS transporter 1